MRKFLFLVALLSTAAPATARPDDNDDARPSRAERAERPVRSESRPPRSERAQPAARAPDAPREFRADRPRDRAMPSGGVERPRWADRPARDRSAGGVQTQPGGGSGDSVRDWRPRSERQGGWADPGSRRGDRLDRRLRDRDSTDREQRDDLDRRFSKRANRHAGARPYDGKWNEHVRDRLAESDVPRPGTQPRLRDRNDGRSRSGEWDRRWRDDRRYDWRRHRDRNRFTFQIGFYRDPFGWNYQRYQPGWRLWPGYYQRNYWLDNPSNYRLPTAYPGTQWIRYHGDAILVDVYTGEVLDVVHDFFW